MQADPAVLHANRIRKGSIAYTEGYVGEGDNRLHYVEAGEGPLILLYHGFPTFWYSWFQQMEMLKAHYCVVAVDALGAGLSAKPDTLEPYKVENLAAQLDGFARAIGGDERFILIGHDWGAALSFAYAQAYPDRLNAVIGMSAPPYNLFLDLVHNSADQQARSHYMQTFRGLTLDTVVRDGWPKSIFHGAYDALIAAESWSAEEAELFRQALSDPKAINGGMNWYRANVGDFAGSAAPYQWPAPENKITVPSMLIWGDEDGTFVDYFLPKMDSIAPGIRIVRIPGVGHWTPMEQAEKANAAIADFLQLTNTLP